MKTLSQELESALKYNGEFNEIPTYIKENLSRKLRDYQEQTLRHFLMQRKSPETNHLMFNMATGSGKTLMMVALMLDCYKRGYKDFIFFVDKTTIIEKTKANFADQNSNKYLFAQKIIIDSKNVEINVIENLDESKEGCINIHFTTIQKLFSLLKDERENALSFEDLRNRKLVFLADEAHHLNSETKNAKLSDEEKEIKEGWEAIIKKAFESHEENLMFEFTATIPRDANVLEKYKNKIIYEYDLAKFCKDGYSKRIFVMKYESLSLYDRFLGGMLLSLFRELIAQKNGIALKPVILFKSETVDKGVNNSRANQEAFIKFVNDLDTHIVDTFYQNLNLKESELFAESLRFFKSELGETYLQGIVNYLKNNFKQTYILSTNSKEDVEKNQILLNSLEDSQNQIRVIFAVDKLNEGWDVLNLFDIVRLNGMGQSKSSTQEIQLIGRGARYYPFVSKKLEFDPELTYKRKFDSDLDNELSILERLSYHTLNEVEFIRNLNKTMAEQGIPSESDTKKRVKLEINPKLEPIIRKNKVFYAKNKKIRRVEGLLRITQKEVKKEFEGLKIPLFSRGIQEDEEKFDGGNEENFLPTTYDLDRIETIFFLKAMNLLGMEYADLEGNFASKEEFIEGCLKKVSVQFSRKQKFDRADNKLAIAQFILEKFKILREKRCLDYEVTPFESHELRAENRVIFTTKEFEVFDYEWLYYQKGEVNELEKDFLSFIDGSKEEISKIYSQWFIVRNDGFEEFKLFDYREDQETYGCGFEPDFIFFGKRRSGDGKFVGFEWFFESKGDHLSGYDSWKEEFLRAIRGEKVGEGQDKVILDALPFFQKGENAEFKQEFLKNFLGNKFSE